MSGQYSAYWGGGRLPRHVLPENKTSNGKDSPRSRSGVALTFIRELYFIRMMFMCMPKALYLAPLDEVVINNFQ